MANAWLRLWHDMPNDPKWRTIARVSGQPIATVMAVYIHLLVSASRNVTRGHIEVTTEDLASALDVTEEVIDSILQTMQGRVLDGDLITGWEKRQVLKEDNGNISQTAKSPAERKRAQRERERKREQNGDCHGASRNVTHMSRRVTTDKDTDKDTDQEDQNTMVHGVKNATNQAGDVQTVNLGQPAGTTPEADSAYALKADSGAVQQVMTARPEQSHQLQQPEADSAIQREADRVVPENTGQSVGRVDYPDVFEQVWREYPLRAGANPKKSAFSAWKARLREGVPPEAMLDGVRRYARYLASGRETLRQLEAKTGATRYLMSVLARELVASGDVYNSGYGLFPSEQARKDWQNARKKLSRAKLKKPVVVDPDLIWSLPDGEIRRYDSRLNIICRECRKSEVMQRILSFYQGDVRYLLK